MPPVFFYTPNKNIRKLLVANVFRGYRKRPDCIFLFFCTKKCNCNCNLQDLIIFFATEALKLDMLFIFLLFPHHIVALKFFRVNLARLILVFLTIETSQQLYRFYFETKALKKQTIQEFRNPPLNLLEKLIL